MAECDVTGCNGMARPQVCEGHARQAHDNVQGFPLLYVRLRGSLVPAKVTGEHVSGSRAPKAAMSMPIWDLMESLVRKTVYWSKIAREHRGVPPMKLSANAPKNLVTATTSLMRHGECLLALSVAGEYVEEMRRLRNRGDVLLKADDLVHRLDAPCPSCELRALYRKDGDEWVVCASCGARWDEREYLRLVRVLVWQLQTLEHRS